MDYKSDLNKKHFYTFIGGKWDLKSRNAKLMLFYDFIEKTINEFPSIRNKEFEIILEFLKNLYKIFGNKKYFDKLLKYTVYLEKKAEELEIEGRKKLKGFIDFSACSDEVKALNNLRINLRILETLFWEAAKEIRGRGELLVIPHFFNVASKYVFYYIVCNYEVHLSEEKSIGIEVDDELFRKYKSIYLNKKLEDYL